MPRPRRVARAALACLLSLSLGWPVVATERTVTATVTINPLLVELAVSPSSVIVGQRSRAQVTVTNIGPASVRSITVTLRAESPSLAVRGSRATALGQLRAGQSTTLSWQVCARQPGAYILLAQATLQGSTIESVARVLVVAEGRRGRC